MRSADRIIGRYRVDAKDGKIGHVADLIVDSEAWDICYMVVDTRDWLPGKKVLVAPAWVDRVSWEGSMVAVDLTREQVENSPEYDPSQPVNREYEARLYDYYGRPRYWSGDR